MEPPAENPAPSGAEPSAPAPTPPAAPEPPASPAPPEAPAPAVSSEAPVDPGISQVPPSTQDTPPPPPPFVPSAAPVENPAPATPGQPLQSAGQATPPAASGAPTVTVGTGGFTPPPSSQVFTPADPTVSAQPKSRFPKKLIIPIIAVLVLVIGAAAFYFGYYNNPSVIYAQSLSDTGKGYDRLITYADKQSKLYDNGVTGSGTYKLSSQSFSTDGKLGYVQDGLNSDFTFDMGVGVSRINAEVRTIKSTGTSPDIYIKASGLKGLGTILGAPDFDPILAKVDNQWIVIDHTMIDNLSAATQSGSASGTSPTREQVMDEARAFGDVNKQYLFTTAKDKAVTRIVKKVGKEKVDGHDTYHYLIALNKDNARKYIQAQESALKGSKLNDWLKANHYDKSVYASFDDMAKSAGDINDNNTYDVWVDLSQRVVYKVRYSYKQNPAYNYVDLGLNYKGGSDYPFFIEGKSKSDGQTATYSYLTDVNTDSGKTDFKFSYKTDGSGGSALSGDFAFQPSSSKVKIERPDKALTVSQVLSYFGFSGPASTGLLTGGAAGSVQLNDNLTGAGAGAAAPTSAAGALNALFTRISQGR